MYLKYVNPKIFYVVRCKYVNKRYHILDVKSKYNIRFTLKTFSLNLPGYFSKIT